MPLLPPRKLETAKAGVGLEKCEDASWAMYAMYPPYGNGRARLAVSDGASESAFSKEWARILARQFVTIIPLLSDGDGMLSWLQSCGEEWSRGIPWDRLPWHGRNKTRAGAFATFLGVTVSLVVDPAGAYPWQAVAVGDSCLFIVRDDAIALAFPLANSGDFNNTPGLVCSNLVGNARIETHIRRVSGECRAGDRMMLATDAVAAWMLREYEGGGKPWEQFIPLDSPAKWDAWVQARRDEKAMRNDDASLMIAHFD